MTRIAMIAPTGNSQIDRVLAGVIGQVNAAGAFEPIEEFKQIPLLSGMTPEMMAEMAEVAGTSGASPGIVEFEVDEAHLPGFKATMAAKLLERWVDAYAQALQHVPAGFARAAINGEIAKVRSGCAAVIEKFEGSPHQVQIQKPFENVLGRPEFEDEDDTTGETDFVGVELSVARVLSACAAPWFAAAEVMPLGGADSDASTHDCDTPAATGTLAQAITIYGDAGSMVSVINQLPENMKNFLFHSEPIVFAEIAWHEERMTDDESDRANGPDATPNPA